MPNDEYFIHDEREFPTRPKFKTDTNVHTFLPDIRYDSICVTFAQIVARATLENLSDEQVEEMLYYLLPWYDTENEQQIKNMIHQCMNLIDENDESWWALGGILIEPYFRH